ncbi:MAG: biotin--[acetyl-CoA-carboxylase] ligase [Pirellulales bacterium]
MQRSSFDLERIRALDWLRQIEYRDTIGSTNDLALELVKARRIEVPALVLAAEQTKGRGRGDNRWWSSAGALTFTLVLAPADDFDRQHWPKLALAAALAIAELIDEMLLRRRPSQGTAGSSGDNAEQPPPMAGIRWPNDVYVGERKLAGLLVEVPATAAPHPAVIVLGLGLNVNNRLDDAPDDVRRRGASLVDLGSPPLDLTSVLVALLERVRSRIDDLTRHDPRMVAAWQQRCLLRGRTVTLEHGPRTVRGRCRGIEADGSLVLETDRGAERLYAGVLTRVE